MNSKNKIIAALVIAVVAAAGAIGYLSRQLNQARQQATSASTAKDAGATNAPTAKTTAPAVTVSVPKRSSAASFRADAFAPNAGRSTPSKSGAQPDSRDVVEFAGKMLDDPKTAALFQSELNSRIASRYQPLLDKLNLTPEQKQQLTGLLVEREMATLDAMRMLRDRPGVSAKEQADTILTVRNDASQPIQQLLGPQYADLTSFDKTVPFRIQADHITSGVALSEEPLTTTQREQLVQDLVQTGKVPAAAYVRDGVFDRDGYLVAVADHDNAVLKSLKDNVSPTQYAALSHYFESERMKTALATAKYVKK